MSKLFHPSKSPGLGLGVALRQVPKLQLAGHEGGYTNTPPQLTADDLYNLAIMQNPQLFVALGSKVATKAATASGSIQLLYKNNNAFPVAMWVEVESTKLDVTALYLGVAATDPASGLAPAMFTSRGGIVLRPSQTLYAAFTGGTSSTIVATAIPLLGRASIFGGS